MATMDRISNYMELLKIRQSARRREATMMGAIFLISFMSMIATGLVSGLGGREIYFVAAMNVVFGIVFVMTWVRLEMIKGTVELLNNLQGMD